MHVRRVVEASRFMVVLGLLISTCAGRGSGWAATVPGNKVMCGRVAFEGEVRAGQEYVKAIGNGLEVMLEPLASGWIVRVLPVGVPRPQHDYAELATPPYQSVNPLLISTDFSFRAQDAVAWNPRHFRFAADRGTFSQMLEAYGQYRSTAVTSATAQDKLARLVGKAPEGNVQILDARLVPGSADQSKMAAAVASHFNTTAHSLEQPADGAGSPLGHITWMRFRITLEVPAGFRVDSGVSTQRHPCLQTVP